MWHLMVRHLWESSLCCTLTLVLILESFFKYWILFVLILWDSLPKVVCSPFSLHNPFSISFCYLFLFSYFFLEFWIVNWSRDMLPQLFLVIPWSYFLKHLFSLSRSSHTHDDHIMFWLSICAKIFCNFKPPYQPLYSFKNFLNYH